ncbi:hypothetical protein B0H13DRAFT_1874832 [Mycena leptocephala]|nr:hypothetical protein B0H13DRAFT_1874832 [Mycena leptocephala]
MFTLRKRMQMLGIGLASTSSGGKGQHLTAPEVIAQKRVLENAKVQDATEKATKKSKREARKVEKERVEVEWKEMRVKHAAAVDARAGRCLQLKAAGTKTKDLPKKPKRPLKPKPKDSDEEDDTSSEDDSDGD